MDKHGKRKLSIALVPKPLQGNNLRTAIGKYRWQKYRRSILPVELRCGTCGAEVAKSSELQAHEEWSYRTGKRNVAKLTSISFQCMLCHGCNHFGLSCLLLGPERIDEPITHYCKVNGVTLNTFRRHLEQAKQIWQRRSQLKWEVDYGEFSYLIAQREAWKNRPPVKLFLNPRTDSESTKNGLGIRRGRPPLFGRPMTRSELAARYRNIKRRTK